MELLSGVGEEGKTTENRISFGLHLIVCVSSCFSFFFPLPAASHFPFCFCVRSWSIGCAPFSTRAPPSGKCGNCRCQVSTNELNKRWRKKKKIATIKYKMTSEIFRGRMVTSTPSSGVNFKTEISEGWKLWEIDLIQIQSSSRELNKNKFEIAVIFNGKFHQLWGTSTPSSGGNFVN